MKNHVLRIIDANFNRAREAARVAEDFARFALDDPALVESAKTLRHELTQLISRLSSDDLLAARDITDDVGADISTPSEQKRTDSLHVALAATARLTEALRSLEEFTKIDHPDLAAKLQALRYRAYDLEKQIIARTSVNERLSQVRLYIILSQQFCTSPLLEVARDVLTAGAHCLQLREKQLPDNKLLTLAKDLSKLAHQNRALFIMNDRADIAECAHADGLHLGQQDLPIRAARKLLGQDKKSNPAENSPGLRKIIGKSCHSPDEAKKALDEGADYLALGSIFAGKTKPTVSVQGLTLIEKVRQFCSRPIIAIGGIDTSNAADVICAGASGIAVCQAVVAQEDPKSAATAILEKIASLKTR